VSSRRSPADQTEVFDSTDDTPVLATALRAADAAEKPKAAEEGGMSMFWRVFGGTILSIVALVAITLFNSLSTSISELRAAVAKLSEERAELVKKDEFGTRMTSNWDRVQTLQAQNNEQNATIRTLRAELDGFKERLARNCTDLESARKELAPVDGLKEKVTTLLAEAKAARDDVTKLRQDVDKNQTADGERKAHRDAQHKEIEKTLKEVQAGLQEVQIKLARLEGSQGAAPPRATPARPMKPAADEKAAEPPGS
jgi:septal ring factor EnvC (AmiA/AmiB activator)